MKYAWKLVCLAAALLVLCGCGQRQAPGTSAVSEPPQYAWGGITGRTLTLWGRDTDLERTYITRALRRYEEATGNTVEAVAFSADELEAEAAEGLRRGADGPDLILSFGGTNIDALDPEENLADLSGEAWVDDLTDTSINQAIYHGKVVGLPHWEASISGTLYNKQIFGELGLTPPRTQAEFQQVCETLLEHGVTPLYLPCASPTMLLYQFPLDTIVEQGDTLDALNQGRLGYEDLPGLGTAVEWYRTMAQKGYLGAFYRENGWDGMSAAMAGGEYAMMLCWDTWLYTDFEGDPSQFGLMPAFVGVPENGSFEGPNLALLLVNRHGAQVDAAMDLISFLADPCNYNAAFEGIYTAPVFKRQKASISTPQYVEAARWIEENYRDSTAWLRIRGFSQSDASCILDYMDAEEDFPAEQCLRDMEALRRERLAEQPKDG